VTGLPAGTFAGAVTDSNGCTVAVSETIAEPGPQTLDVTGTNNPCIGALEGTATADFVNATGTVTYEWTGGRTGATITSLAAGTYDVTATDQNNCVLTGSIDITEPAAVVLGITTTDAICFAGNGSATATPVGGTSPFTFLWSDSSTGQTVAI